MQSMKAAATRISESAKTTGGSKFCSDVVAIEFNAWHYADTNLWASLVAHILESLAEYVSPNETPEQQQAKLVQELDSAKEVVSQIESEKASAEAQIAERQSELQKLQLERERKELELRDLRLTDLQALLLEDPVLEQDVKKALEDMGVPAALSSLSDLGQAVAEVNSVRGRITALVVGLFKAQNRGTVSLLLVLLLALPFLGAWIYQYFANSFVVVGTVVAQATAFVGGAVVFLRKAAAYVTTNLDKVEAAKRRVDKALADRRKAPGPKEADLQKEIVALKTQEEQVASRLRAATAKVIDLEQRIVSLTESRSLARFLTERTKSDDYRKHLGLISIIRQDFETLTARLQSPARAPGLRRVERIILYIDDLDRCPANKVIDVLQAVHLLLAYPLFLVVVGVDPRWLSHSLTATYGAFKDANFPSSDPELWHTTPQNYLEKIFQIPFSLRPMTAAGYTRLVQGLFSAAYRAAAKPTHAPEPLPLQMPVSPGERDLVGPSHDGPGSLQPPDLDGQGGTRNDTPRDPEFTIHDEALEIKAVEANFAERLYILLPTPRATKRFANIYRILKAPILPEYLETFEGTEHAPGTFQVPMLLLATLVGMPSEAAILFPNLFDRVAKGNDPIEDLAALETLGFNKNMPAALRDKVSEIVADSTFPRSPELFFYWLPRVSRFSFEIGRAVRPAFVAQTRS
jgi:KAP family P-loop domain